MVREAHVKIPMGPQKNIVLVAHDNKKQDLLEWARFNREVLLQHKLYATGTTGLFCVSARYTFVVAEGLWRPYR